MEDEDFTPCHGGCFEEQAEIGRARAAVLRAHHEALVAKAASTEPDFVAEVTAAAAEVRAAHQGAAVEEEVVKEVKPKAAAKKKTEAEDVADAPSSDSADA